MGKENAKETEPKKEHRVTGLDSESSSISVWRRHLMIGGLN